MREENGAQRMGWKRVEKRKDGIEQTRKGKTEETRSAGETKKNERREWGRKG